MENEIMYSYVKPAPALEDFVESFWQLHNLSDKAKEVIVLPDGRIDLFISQSLVEPFHIILLGIGTQFEHPIIAAKQRTFAISFKPLAMEYLFKSKLPIIADQVIEMPHNFWGFNPTDLTNFSLFCEKASQQILSLLPTEIDERKRKLFQLLYASNGELTVQELSDNVIWSSRQINRYFNQQLGLPLKKYSNILRFRSSFQQLREGKLFPENNFADQSHFIKAVKQLAGVSPKELAKNKNDRFIQLSTLPAK